MAHKFSDNALVQEIFETIAEVQGTVYGSDLDPEIVETLNRSVESMRRAASVLSEAGL